ncbi:MAG: hypothetical protein LUF27_06115 [Lachnospiraceae bacterium]|nr:hypothetical protein [Lachnospiraceae bacterium]
MNNQTLGTTIALLRKEKGMTQSALAEKLEKDADAMAVTRLIAIYLKKENAGSISCNNQ